MRSGRHFMFTDLTPCWLGGKPGRPGTPVCGAGTESLNVQRNGKRSPRLLRILARPTENFHIPPRFRSELFDILLFA